jgi:hypothetical protein
MKNLLLVILCFVAFKSFSQTNEILVEEKASEWIKITVPESTTRPKTTTTVKKKTTTNKPETPKQNTQEEFEKTNQQVNRFKKQKKG